MTDAFDELLPEPAGTTTGYRWATVTQLAPIRIRLDGDTLPVESTPDALCPLQVGDRVWVQFHGRAMIILGASWAP